MHHPVSMPRYPHQTHHDVAWPAGTCWAWLIAEITVDPSATLFPTFSVFFRCLCLRSFFQLKMFGCWALGTGRLRGRVVVGQKDEADWSYWTWRNIGLVIVCSENGCWNLGAECKGLCCADSEGQAAQGPDASGLSAVVMVRLFNWLNVLGG